MARVDDLDTKIKSTSSRKAKCQATECRASTAKARTKKSAKKRAVKTIIVDVAGVTYVGWYWIENRRMYVTYHERPKPAEFACTCCTQDGAAANVRQL